MEGLVDQLRKEWPATFAGTRIGELSGGAISWGTIQNKRSRKEIPRDCFVYVGPKVLVVRDRFLDWWGSQLSAVAGELGPRKEGSHQTPQSHTKAAVA